jgi:DNA-directed RNA polymerase subunit RPC12/RpoP
MDKKVEMTPTLTWTCSVCGRDWWVEMFVEDEKGGAKTLYVPPDVKCPHCNSEFETTLFGK